MKNLGILSGAGMSAESGISTFRDAGGLWDKYPVEQVATPEGYARNPELVINFYNERRKQMLEVVPNAGHLGVADLERDFNVTVVAQNVDNLHERAGSKRVIHLHGELTKVCSSRDPYNPHYIKELKPDEYEVKLRDKAGDGTQLRPFIVWFGESVPEIETAVEYVENGKLVKWLKNHDEGALAKQVEALDPEDDAMPRKLCELIGVPYDEAAYQAALEAKDQDAIVRVAYTGCELSKATLQKIKDLGYEVSDGRSL